MDAVDFKYYPVRFDLNPWESIVGPVRDGGRVTEAARNVLGRVVEGMGHHEPPFLAWPSESGGAVIVSGDEDGERVQVAVILAEGRGSFLHFAKQSLTLITSCLADNDIRETRPHGEEVVRRKRAVEVETGGGAGF